MDILVNNAGIYLDESEPALSADIGKIHATLEVNTCGPLRVTRALIPLMKKNGYGRVVKVSSGMGRFAEIGTGSTGYRLSKTALNALTVILANELAGTGITVNAACPGWVRTDMGGAEAPLSVAEGADNPVWVATESNETGKFYREHEIISW